MDWFNLCCCFSLGFGSRMSTNWCVAWSGHVWSMRSHVLDTQVGTDDLDAVSRPVAHLHASCSLHRSNQLFLLLRLQLLWLPMAPRKSLDSFKVRRSSARAHARLGDLGGTMEDLGQWFLIGLISSFWLDYSIIFHLIHSNVGNLIVNLQRFRPPIHGDFRDGFLLSLPVRDKLAHPMWNNHTLMRCVKLRQMSKQRKYPNLHWQMHWTLYACLNGQRNSILTCFKNEKIKMS